MLLFIISHRDPENIYPLYYSYWWFLLFHPGLQLVLDDSERIRSTLQDYGPVLDEISAVCDMSSQQEQLDHNDKQVHKMQRKILEPLQHLLEAVGVKKKDSL